MLLYFDIFQYPLNKRELALAVNNAKELDECLYELKEMGVVEQENEWYFINGRKYSKRISEVTSSAHFYKKARKYSSIISQFPFVRGVYISGSLSKDWADNTTDVDYFIVTAPQRLWICRTLLILFKKIFLFNSRKYFCLNYFIDTDDLKIEEKNIFTATEICFLKPVVNESLYHQFINANGWIHQYYGSKPEFDSANLIDKKDGVHKRVAERILSGSLGEKLDIWSMKRTLKFWRKKFPNMENNDFEINFKANRSISKHHPSGFQKKVVEALDLRMKEFENTTQISLQ